MTTHRVRTRISGPNLSPETMPLSTLLEILQHFNAAVMALHDAQGDAETGPALSLVAVESGSEELVFSVPKALGPPLVELSRAVARGEPSKLPRPSHRALTSLAETVTSRGWGFGLCPSPDLPLQPFRLDRDHPVPPPVRMSSLEGTTTIHGQLLRVGGATRPRVEIRLTKNGELLHLDLSEEVARELARRLYETVALEGRATWDPASWELEAFRVERVVPLRPLQLDAVFEHLSRSSKGAWDDVDAAAYVRDLRGTTDTSE